MDVNQIREVVMTFTMHFHDWWMKFWGPVSFLEISTPSRDVMIVNYCSVNEKTVDKMNVKIVSAMLNEVRSILANTWEPDSFQINQFHNKDLSQHQLNWPGEWFCFINECFLIDLFRKICVPNGSIYFCGNMWTTCETFFRNFSS